MKRWHWMFLVVGLLVTVGILWGQVGTVVGLIPVWVGSRWTYVGLGPAFTLSGGVLNVPVTQGPPGPVGPTGPVGPIGPSGSFAANDLYQLSSPLATLTLKCPAGDIFRDGFLLSETIDYTISGLTITFLNVPQSGDVVKVTYRCSQ